MVFITALWFFDSSYKVSLVSIRTQTLVQPSVSLSAELASMTQGFGLIRRIVKKTRLYSPRQLEQNVLFFNVTFL